MRIAGELAEAGADALFVSIIPHNREVLAFAHRRGYDTLNTVELRKESKGERPRRGDVMMFGLRWQTL
jgi:2-methylisocitrate lyase-like PEP mutase family enzyme